MLSWAEGQKIDQDLQDLAGVSTRLRGVLVQTGFPVGLILAQVPALNKRESGRCRMQKEIKIDRRLRKMEFFGGISSGVPNELNQWGLGGPGGRDVGGSASHSNRGSLDVLNGNWKTKKLQR